jgi:hypothetical protein
MKYPSSFFTSVLAATVTQYEEPLSLKYVEVLCCGVFIYAFFVLGFEPRALHYCPGLASSHYSAYYTCLLHS